MSKELFFLHFAMGSNFKIVGKTPRGRPKYNPEYYEALCTIQILTKNKTIYRHEHNGEISAEELRRDTKYFLETIGAIKTRLFSEIGEVW